MSKRKIASYYRTIHTYKVEGITSQTDAEIIEYCDRNAFGGRVSRCGDGVAIVEVDID